MVKCLSVKTSENPLNKNYRLAAGIVRFEKIELYCSPETFLEIFDAPCSDTFANAAG